MSCNRSALQLRKDERLAPPCLGLFHEISSRDAQCLRDFLNRTEFGVSESALDQRHVGRVHSCPLCQCLLAEFCLDTAAANRLSEPPNDRLSRHKETIRTTDSYTPQTTVMFDSPSADRTRGAEAPRPHTIGNRRSTLKPRAFLLCIAAAATACAHQITVNPNMHPNSFSGSKWPLSVAVICSPRLQQMTLSASPSTQLCAAHTFNFDMGESLCQALIRSVEGGYQKVTVASSVAEARGVHRVIKFSLMQNNVDVQFQEGFFTATAKINHHLTVSIESYDARTRSLIGKYTVNGAGFGSRKAGCANSSALALFREAVEDSMQQAVDQAANLAVSGSLEPRTRAGSTTRSYPAAPAPRR